MRIVEELAQSMEMDDKSVYSHKVYNTVALISSITSAVLEVLCFILYLTVPQIGLYTFSLVFYPLAILLLVTFFFSIPELLRNIYMSSLIALLVASVMIILLIVAVFLQGFLLGTVYIVPFMFF